MGKDIAYSANGKRNMKKMIIVIIVSIMLIVAVVGVSVVVYNNQPTVQIQNAMVQGEKYLSELDYEKAIASYMAAIEISPAEEQAYLGLINTYAQQKDYQQVANLFAVAIEKISEDVVGDFTGNVLEILRKGAEQGVADGIYETALFCYEQMLLIDAENEELKDALCKVYLVLAEKEETEGNYEKALVYCDKILAISPKDIEIQEQVSAYLGETEKNEETEKSGWEETEYASTGDYVVYEYDYEGKVIKRAEYDSSNILRGSEEYVYDNNKLVKVYYSMTDGRTYRVDIYNEDGNVISASMYNEDGTAGYRYEYEYNEGGNCVGSKWLLPDGSMYFRYEYEYDDNGREIKSTCYDMESKLFFWTISEYDKNGNLGKIYQYDDDGTLNFLYEYEYKNEGKIEIEKFYHSDGTIWSERIIEYDSKGTEITNQYNSFY